PAPHVLTAPLTPEGRLRATPQRGFPPPYSSHDQLSGEEGGGGRNGADQDRLGTAAEPGATGHRRLRRSRHEQRHQRAADGEPERGGDGDGKRVRDDGKGRAEGVCERDDEAGTERRSGRRRGEARLFGH